MNLLPQELESQISQHSISLDCMEVRWAAMLFMRVHDPCNTDGVGRASAFAERRPQGLLSCKLPASLCWNTPCL